MGHCNYLKLRNFGAKWAYLAVLFLMACQTSQPVKDVITLPNSLTELEIPASEGAEEPHLFHAPDGKLYLSWTEPENDSIYLLKFSVLDQANMAWSEPKTVAKGSEWFVNWADFPSVVTNKNGVMAAHWLAKNNVGTYDYNVTVSLSPNQGQSWLAPFVPHGEASAGEHGFVTLLPQSDGSFFATWLDGRNTVGHAHGETHQHQGEEMKGMTLRAARFDESGKIFDEAELDGLTCDCCQTDAAMTAKGMVVVYRDRSPEEIRDIYITREENGHWSTPKPIFDDNWMIKGCPVNGPAVAANDQNTAVAWFTGEPKAAVKLAFSKDAGDSFSSPIVLDSLQPIGRVDVLLLEGNQAVVSWMDVKEDQAVIKLALVSDQGMVEWEKEVAEVPNSRASGFPILEQHAGKIWLAWNLPGEPSQIKTAFWDLGAEM
jgi:hypothetical protein